ncbi:LacI family DNA-binding transcriptional regulator [Paenibacillus antarcticus]|uniref:LacI family transcriptional regulator n=1 Tax=Paenibacillus antarcticus TaxID=253703 RepID=A0A162MCK5_9BACL|nr:LacI family DNA-binding transcriptional regulator [Paenibacillus antarcticus]OAB47145.1 LacI family transcriptional regulator [Paenibacillus antarcticus]
MKSNISDVAKLAGVSPTTVSRVMNNRGYISQETRDKVDNAMKELNYFPNDLARALFNKRTNLIGLIVPTTTNPFFGELSFHIENICTSLGYKVLLCNSLSQMEKEQSYADMLMRNQVDGIIVGAHNRGISNYNQRNIAVVAIDRYLSKTIPVVGSDNYTGGTLATELLISKGCKNIIHMNGPVELETPATLRRKAYEDVMEGHGRQAITYEVRDPFRQQNHYEVIDRLFDECPNVDGLFASNDLVAASFIAEARKRGKDIPNDIKVVGYDGTETCQILLPELTTIRQPIALIAKTAVELLIKEIEGEYHDLPLETYLPVELIEGNTTGTIA